jgi:Tol biopolymer transport system component
MKYIHQIFIYLFIICLPQNGFSQYFGRNKPSYRVFDYKVYQTPHFDIYHYWHNDSLKNRYAQTAETWYKRHQFVLHDTLKFKNPLIIYSNHADFQQTNAIMGEISIGTGGVTEAMKNRVVIPILDSWAQSNHVLGHELVHAFQYNMIIHGDSTTMNNLRNLPIWMVEGMAEYMSIGTTDTHTAMWLRDAVINNDFPTIRQLGYDYHYFPYRYGQAFWAFTTRLYGDSIIRPLFKLTALTNYEFALDSLLGYDEETYSKLWKKATFDYYRKWIKPSDTIDHVVGTKLLSSDNAGDMNLAPAISPNGKYIAFLSEKNIFSVDLYLADVKSGKIIRELSSAERNNDYDDFSYIESSGTWSPDNKKLAYVVISHGRDKLLVIDVDKPKKQREYEVPGVPALSNPSWSPLGDKIVVSGQVDGISALYLFDIHKGKAQKLTSDPYAHLQPSWSPDGTKILFSTDKPTSDTDTLLNGGYSLGIIDLKESKTTYYNLFPEAENMNPIFSPDGKSIYFLSNCDGFRNLYQFLPDSNKVYRLTNILTGISGVTPYSPAMSIARDTNLIVYSYYGKGKYTVYKASTSEFKHDVVDPTKTDMRAGMLPPATPVGSDIIDKTVNRPDRDSVSRSLMDEIPYRPKFKLDYIGNTGMGVATSRYGTGIAGSMEMLFSDMVGNNTVYTNVAISGEIYDFGGMLAYVNSKHRINWGLSLSHIPYSYGQMYSQTDSTTFGRPVDKVVVDYYRLFQEQLALFGSYPLSSTKRFELSASLSYYSYRLDRYNYYYEQNSYNSLGSDRQRNLPTHPGFNIKEFEAAYVVDNSYFGIASPLRGNRSRIAVGQYFGGVTMHTLVLDFRKYIYLRPFCLAFRAMHYGRYGANTDSTLLTPYFIGYPWYVRGYDNSYFSSTNHSKGVSINQLQGSRFGIVNLELRVPFTGPEKVSLIKSKSFYTELAVFFDGGLAWDSQHHPDWSFDYTRRGTDDYRRLPVFSTGISMRFNLFGVMVIEPFYAMPLGQGSKAASFGLNFFPGW